MPDAQIRSIIIRTVLALVAFLALYLMVMVLFAEQLAAIGAWMTRNGGLVGVFIFTLLVDTFIVPASADVLFAVTLDWAPVPLLLTMSLASMIGGFLGKSIGRFIGDRAFVHILTAPYRERGEDLVRRRGAWAIVIAGLTPVPYSTVSWIAGIMKMKTLPYLVASLSRLPRFVLYYLAIRGSLSIFGIGVP